MASEPPDESVSVTLPPDLAEWIDEQAAERDADRETVLLQLLAAYRAAEDVEESADLDAESLLTREAVEEEVQNIVAERISDIAGAVAEQLEIERQVEDAVDAQLSEASRSAAEQATDQLQGQIDAVEDDFMGKIEDVRDRVIQVKKETDRKAPAEHTHPDLLDRINTLRNEVETLESEVETLQTDLDGAVDSQEERLDEIDETVWDMQEKLRNVAWVVNDLRDSGQLQNKRATSVEGIKRAAAGHDIDRARCEVCGEGVEIALMTDPECPHCQAAVNDVEPGEGLFGKPKLVKARGIEPAEDDG